MTSVQISLTRPTIILTYISERRNLPSTPCSFPTYAMPTLTNSLRLSSNALSYRRCKPVCVFGGKGKSENGSEASPWKAFEKAMGSFKKEQSVEDILRQQIEKEDYFDNGGSGGSPPRGGGDDSGGSEDEGIAGILDEVVQVIFATVGFIFLYIYIISGEEITRLVKDYIKYILGGGKSVRLKRAMYKWGRFYKRLTRKEQVQSDWLEREIINTPTWWDSPAKYRSILKRNIESTANQ